MSSLSNGESYIYHMPYKERKRLCNILDQNSKWKELGGHMQFDVPKIQEIERRILCGQSPCDELLTLWGHQNHTILELFVLLSRMQHYRAMEEIKHLVDGKYHRLITDGEQNLCRLFSQLGQRQNGFIRAVADANQPDTNSDNNAVTQSSKILNIPKKNTPRIIIESEKIMNNNNAISDENNESQLSPNNGSDPIASPRLSPQPGKTSMSGISDISNISESVSAIPKIAYDELQTATDDWNEANILGRGGFGIVFKGVWKNTSVAIKRIEARGMSSAESYNTQMEQSMRELRYLNGCRHDNILSLYGYSMDGREPCLVYQYMSGGSLEQQFQSARRNRRPALTWLLRKNIARGTARGLQFLHTYNKEKPLIHGDIKSANILLDQCNEPRIGDFGLAREGPHSDYSHLKVTRVHGTRPYLPEEFLRCRKLSTKVDTYSFGVVLFELATGLSAYDESRKYKFLKDHAVINCEENNEDILQDMKADDSSTTEGKTIFHDLITLGRRCVHKKASNRPEMVKVLESLENNS